MSVNYAGMTIGGMAAALCIVREVGRDGLVAALLLGGLAAWGALATWNVIYDLKFERDRAHAILRQHRLYPFNRE